MARREGARRRPANTRPGVSRSTMWRSLPKSLRDQRIGRRDRRIGDADIAWRQARAARARGRCRRGSRSAARARGRARAAPAPMRAHLLERLRVAERAPAAARIALRQEDAVGRGRRPVLEPLGELRRVGRERMRRAEQDRAVRPALDHARRAGRAAPAAAARRGGRDAALRAGCVMVRCDRLPSVVHGLGRALLQERLEPRLGLVVALRDRRDQRLRQVAAGRIAARRCAAARA